VGEERSPNWRPNLGSGRETAEWEAEAWVWKVIVGMWRYHLSGGREIAKLEAESWLEKGNGKGINFCEPSSMSLKKLKGRMFRFRNSPGVISRPSGEWPSHCGAKCLCRPRRATGRSRNQHRSNSSTPQCFDSETVRA
jgi:hypothetical protein